ncbi:DUF4168 domain-containing protein [Alteromonas sp. C1M14]|uniref:DUF4168 domain-containing protein n=1 Tax=Alteromonas sp. C1M14 TaxID=2841567 RepID=UPI001C09034D|nr:DUF4168 domain-containing protein [Alteromonas sp. C1M14]MBU2978608.1 DUF4168 domain-containing protein [Alteromonas sp. C1M14]
MSTFVKSLVLSLAVASTISFGAQAAQDTMTMEKPDESMVESASYDDATLEKFTMAMSAVSDVADKYQSELSGDVSAEKVQEIQQAAQSEMVAEIEKTGLEVDTYTTIAQQVQTDESLRQRVLSIAKANNEES